MSDGLKVYKASVGPDHHDFAPWQMTSVATALRHYIIDTSGTPYFDFSVKGSSLPVGHADPDVAEAIAAHAGSQPIGMGSLRWAYTQSQMDYTEALMQHFPDGSSISYAETETEAIADLVSWLSPTVKMLMVNTERVNPMPYGLRVDPETNLLEEFVRHWESGYRPTVIWVTGVHRATFDLVTPAQFGALLDIKERYGEHLTFVWDARNTCFGWANQQQFMAPDLADVVILGGALGGGMPMGAVVRKDGGGRYRIADSNVMGGLPLACAAGLATYRKAEELRAKNMDLPGVLATGLDDMAIQFSEIRRITGLGLLRGIDFRSVGHAARFVAGMHKAGFFLSRPADDLGRVVPIAMPLTCEAIDAHELVNAIFETVMKMRDDGSEI